MRERARGAESMDDPSIDPAALRSEHRFIRFVNRFLNGRRASLRALASLGRVATVLDVGTGTGDIPTAMRARVVGVDLHRGTLALARSLSCFPLVRADGRRLPFANASFDVAHAAMFLHHLDDAGVVAALREMDRVARVGVVVNDLVRNRRAALWASALSLVAGAGVRRDAALSVRRGFTREEALALARRAGLPYLRYTRRFGHRFTLCGRKPCTTPW
jgi:SAM-dependent methyltransferase